MGHFFLFGSDLEVQVLFLLVGSTLGGSISVPLGLLLVLVLLGG